MGPIPKSGYVNIKINKETGRLVGITFTDKKGEPIKPSVKKAPGPVVVGKNVKILDRITWFTSNPTCVWHDGRLY